MRIIGYDDGLPMFELPDGTKVVSVPQPAFRSIKDKAREAGRGEAAMDFQAQLDAWAKAQGFTDGADLATKIKAHAGAGAPVPETPAPAPTPADPPADPLAARRAERAARLQGELASQTSRSRAKYDAEVARRKAAEEASATAKFERQIAIEAVRAGVQDVDYAVDLMRRELAALDEAAIAAFDEKAWYADLRKTRPALFEAQVVPVQSGTDGDAPETPDPGDVLSGGASGSKVDMRTATPEQYAAYMAAKGLTPPGHGMPVR